MIRVLIADDHGIVRSGLRMLIDKQSDMEVVAEVEDGVAALESAQRHHPTVAVLDVSMPRMDQTVASAAAALAQVLEQRRAISARPTPRRQRPAATKKRADLADRLGPRPGSRLIAAGADEPEQRPPSSSAMKASQVRVLEQRARADARRLASGNSCPAGQQRA